MSALGLLAGVTTSAAVVAIARSSHRWHAATRTRSVVTPRRATAFGRRGPRALAVGLAVAALLPIAPPVAAALLVAAAAVPRLARRKIQQREERAVADALPDAVDLLLLCTSAGRALPLAHPLVAERVAPALADALRLAARDAALGRPRADALVDALSPLGDHPRRLGRLLADHLRYGVALAPALERLGTELRVDRRRRAERDARRVPVRLLAPLIVCVLPAFALLTVVPLLAASLRTLPL